MTLISDEYFEMDWSYLVLAFLRDPIVVVLAVL